MSQKYDMTGMLDWSARVMTDAARDDRSSSWIARLMNGESIQRMLESMAQLLDIQSERRWMIPAGVALIPLGSDSEVGRRTRPWRGRLSRWWELWMRSLADHTRIGEETIACWGCRA